MGKIIEKIDESVNNIIDEKLQELKDNKITDLEFWRRITPEDPYFIRNKILYSIESPVIQKEINIQKENHKYNVPYLHFNIDILNEKKNKFIHVFPELESIIFEILLNLSKDECKGCAKNKEYNKIYRKIVEINKSDLEKNIVRDLSVLKNIVPDIFIENWKNTTTINFPVLITRYINSPSPEELEALKISAMNSNKDISNINFQNKSNKKSVLWK